MKEICVPYCIKQTMGQTSAYLQIGQAACDLINDEI